MVDKKDKQESAGSSGATGTVATPGMATGVYQPGRYPSKTYPKWEEFIENFKLSRAVNGWDEAQAKLLLGYALTGHALTEYLQLPQPIKDGAIDPFIAELTSKLGEPANPRLLKIQFRNCFQEQNEEVADFGRRVRKLAYRSPGRGSKRTVY